MNHLLLLTLVLLLPVAPIACGRSEPQSGLETIQMPIGSQTFTLEVADSYFEQKQGLMHRRSMPADHGMIFVFAAESPRGFWMKNTYIPLDIIYADAQGKVVSIHQMKPLDESPVNSAAPAKFAIELNQGAAQQAGVKVGDILPIPARFRE